MRGRKGRRKGRRGEERKRIFFGRLDWDGDGDGDWDGDNAKE